MVVHRASAVVAVLVWGIFGVMASAKQPAATPPGQPLPPAEAAPALPVETLAIDPCCDVAPKCCPAPCITYHHRRHRKACYDPCQGMASMVLAVKDPCCCCNVDVPVCVPACCTDVPCVNSRCGLFGRGIVEYSWDCGFRVQIVFNKHGKVRVTYFHG
jgi:hypothetical protein